MKWEASRKRMAGTGWDCLQCRARQIVSMENSRVAQDYRKLLLMVAEQSRDSI